MEMYTTDSILSAKQGGDITYKDMVEEVEPNLGESQIKKTFSQATVFMTGGTGFLGKLLLDKMLRSFPDIKKIYVLARPKKDKCTLKRIEEQFNDVLYEKLKKECPDFMDKLVIVEGDVGEIGLAIKDEDRQKIINEVDIIFHGAATVRFDEPLKTAVNINVRGTREMMLLARNCHKLKAMVHISTAYSNCNRRDIGEQFYESALPGDQLIDLVENLDTKIIGNITPGLLGDLPNTYVFTKCAAEDIIVKYSKGLPVSVVRPAIVIGTVREPVAGWIDNVYGPTGVVVGAAVGLLHSLHCNPKAIADLVPGDWVVNACIAAAWKISTDGPRNHEDCPPPDQPPTIYNYVSSEQRPLTWETFMYFNELYGLDSPSNQAVYYYMFSLVPSRLLYKLRCLLLHWIPAYIVDGVAVVIGKKPMLRKAYTKIEKFSEVISYFSTRHWKFDNSNTQNLYRELAPADQKIFTFDMNEVCWSEYFITYVRGIRLYLLKESADTIPEALQKFRRLKYLHYFLVAIFSFIFIRFLLLAFQYVFGL